MSKTRHSPPGKAGVQAFLWLVVVVGLVAAGLWAWQRVHRTPASALYSEPGWMPAHPSNQWKCIVIHHSAGEEGGAERFDAWHKKRGWEGLGYHFVIGNGSDTGDGEVEIGFRWEKQERGAHCKTEDGFYNEHGIGICLVGNFNNHPPDEKQLRSLARLVRFLCHEFHIPPSQIFTHGGVTGKTECPGKDFDLAALRSRVVAGKD